MSSVLSIEHTLVFIWKTQINKARVSISTNKLWGKSELADKLTRIGEKPSSPPKEPKIPPINQISTTYTP